MQRMTRQRLAVISTMRKDLSFRSAQQIHSALEHDGHTVSLASVYRNIHALVVSGQADTVHSGDGEQLYRLCEQNEHHHHLVCETCGGTEEVNLEFIEPLLETIAKEKGYQLTGHDLELYGICTKCS